MPIDPVGARAVYDFLWYSGVAGAMLVLIVLLVRGRLVADVHHQWVIAALSRDRDEWRDHAKELQEAVTALQHGLSTLLEQSRERRRR